MLPGMTSILIVQYKAWRNVGPFDIGCQLLLDFAGEIIRVSFAEERNGMQTRHTNLDICNSEVIEAELSQQEAIIIVNICLRGFRFQTTSLHESFTWLFDQISRRIQGIYLVLIADKPCLYMAARSPHVAHWKMM